MKINLKQYAAYLIRWQLSTPILAIVLKVLVTLNTWTATIVANFVGGLIFFWVDKFIFTSKLLTSQWEVKEKEYCYDCGKYTRCYRLVKSTNYDKTKDPNPKYRCESCSVSKTEKLRTLGVSI